MKRGWIGLALLVVLLASSLFTAKKMEEYHNDGAQMLTQAGTCALEENWAAARELAFQAMKQWQKHREFTAAFADHEPMEDVDCLFVDMPPGTGDVPLTVFQSLPIDGVVIVTTPQDLVSMIVAKAVKMANMMHIPVLGFVENYSYLECPDCGKKIEVFGKSHINEIAAKFDLPVLAKLPIDPSMAEAYDNGLMETVNTDAVGGVIEAVLKA